ncbi:MAG TPA: hypothetical protein PLV89_13045 [Treponemataceae bacterium]|nr:hypothetical protein [Treponemataceae bacterium]
MHDYLLLDRHEHVPLKITAHLLACKKCRTEVRLLTIADKACTKPLSIPVPITSDSITSIMKAVIPNYTVEEPVFNKVSLKRWVISGLVMIFAMLFFGINSYSQNSQIAVSVYLVFAAVITAYLALFVAGNMDFFIKKLKNLQISL